MSKPLVNEPPGKALDFSRRLFSLLGFFTFLQRKQLLPLIADQFAEIQRP